MPDSSAPPPGAAIRSRLRVGAGARSFVGKRSNPQKVGVVVAVLLALTAPFGGLRGDERADTGPLVLGQPVDIGPFEVTIKKVVTLGDLAPAVTPEPGNRLLVIDLVVANTSDRAEYASLVSGALSGTGIMALAWPGDTVAAPRLFGISDAVRVPPQEFINPGVSYEYAAVLQQAAGTDPSGARLALTGYTFRADDPLTLDDDVWELQDRLLVEGPVAVEVKP